MCCSCKADDEPRQAQKIAPGLLAVGAVAASGWSIEKKEQGRGGGRGRGKREVGCAVGQRRKVEQDAREQRDTRMGRMTICTADLTDIALASAAGLVVTSAVVRGQGRRRGGGG